MNAQLKKGLVELCILSLINKHNEMYGYEIIEKVEQGFSNTPEATVYLALKRLYEKKLIDCVLKSSQYGPPRKYYHLLSAGKQELEAMVGEWKELTEIVNKFVMGDQ